MTADGTDGAEVLPIESEHGVGTEVGGESRVHRVSDPDAHVLVESHQSTSGVQMGRQVWHLVPSDVNFTQNVIQDGDRCFDPYPIRDQIVQFG